MTKNLTASVRARLTNRAKEGRRGQDEDDAGTMTASNERSFDVEQGLIELAGTPARWIWSFTCPTPRCACRSVVILSAQGDRAALVESARPVVNAWRGDGHFGQAAEELAGFTSFAKDLDTRELFPAAGDEPLDAAAHPEVRSIVDRLDDDVLDDIARNWYRAKGEPPPLDPGASNAKIEVEGWRPGRPVFWDEVQPFLRGDRYVFGEHLFDALELYCVEAGCDRNWATVDFVPVAPRGSPPPGCVEFDGQEAALRPEHERHRGRLSELWAAYCARHARYPERFAHRCAIVHGLAGRVVSAPPKPKVGRNDLCPCGSGRKFKKCCGAA